MLPEHPEEYVVVYPGIDEDAVLYVPGFIATVVPDEEPNDEFGLGLLPVTEIVKSDGFFVPPFVLSTTVVTIIVPVRGLYTWVMVRLIGTPPLAVPEHPEEYVV